MPRASCASCGKSYNVPETGKAYRCKECGSTVEAAAEESCPACGALLPDGVQFCEECGAAVAAEATGAAAGPQDETERRLANREMAKAKDSIRAVRVLYIALAVVFAVLLTIMTITVGRFAASILKETWFWVIAGIMVCEIGLFAACAVRIARQPLFWSITIAAFDTVRVALLLLGGGVGLITIFWILVVIALWSVVLRVASVRRFIQRYPELWDTATRLKQKARRRARKGGTDLGRGQARHRQDSLARQRRNRLLLVAGAVVVLAGMIGFIGYRMGGAPAEPETVAPPPFAPVLDQFVTAWEANRLSAVTEFFREDRRPKTRAWLTKKSSKRDWRDRLPELSDPSFDYDAPDRKYVVFSAGGGNLTTRWRCEDGAWRISTIKFE